MSNWSNQNISSTNWSNNGRTYISTPLGLLLAITITSSIPNNVVAYTKQNLSSTNWANGNLASTSYVGRYYSVILTNDSGTTMNNSAITMNDAHLNTTEAKKTGYIDVNHGV
jgi:hypothetical protein